MSHYRVELVGSAVVAQYWGELVGLAEASHYRVELVGSAEVAHYREELVYFVKSLALPAALVIEAALVDHTHRGDTNRITKCICIVLVVYILNMYNNNYNYNYYYISLQEYIHCTQASTYQ